MAPSAVEEPIQRILTRGPQGLTDREILAVLLGRESEPGIEPAADLLAETGSLGSLALAQDRLTYNSGLGDERAAVLLAAVEFSRRIARANLPQRDLLSHPEAIATYLHLQYGREDQEVAGALYLDVRNRLIADTEIFRGALCRASVEPRQILKEGLLRGAAQFVFFHTHPSGDPAPSSEDLLFTKRLTAAGEVLGISLLDHMIIGHGGHWTSLQRRSGWWRHRDAPPATTKTAKRRKVKPKYRHPETGETWTGRGRMARWLRAEIEAGAKREDFLIQHS